MWVDICFWKLISNWNVAASSFRTNKQLPNWSTKSVDNIIWVKPNISVFITKKSETTMTKKENLDLQSDRSSDERMWLPTDKKLLDQEIFKRDSSSPTLFFAVRCDRWTNHRSTSIHHRSTFRFVIKSFLWLQNATTVMLFFLSTRYAIYRVSRVNNRFVRRGKKQSNRSFSVFGETVRMCH